jgi:murein DD-endopeptidase MepM/ murein hydrolase activator NlpD
MSIAASLPGMTGRLSAAVFLIFLATAALVAVGSPRREAQAQSMCPPVTIDDLFPSETTPPATNPPATSPTTTDTTIPGSTVPTTQSTTTTQPEDTPTTTGPTTTQPGDDSTTTTIGTGSQSTTTTTGPTSPTGNASCRPFVYSMLWPLAGRGQYISGFGADRDHGARHHEGVDIAAPHMTPVVAVADGVVVVVVQEAGTDQCCWTGIRHNDGWESFYIHLNNDLFGTDDGTGVGVRADLVPGTRVQAGEVIGWVGDSGNAEDTVYHLHFELRTPQGVPVDPWPSLKQSMRRADLPAPTPSWPYDDDEGGDQEVLAALLLSQGLYLPCDVEAQTSFCADRAASPDFARSVAGFFSGEEAPLIPGREQILPWAGSDSSSRRQLEEMIGCEPLEECLDVGVTEADLARLAQWVQDDAAAVGRLPEVPDLDQMPEIRLREPTEAETALRASGSIAECRPPLDDETLVHRGQALELLASWAQGFDPILCVDQTRPTN